MSLSPRLLITLLLMAVLSSCAVKKGGKRHRKPSGGSGNGCDCPSFSRAMPDGILPIDNFEAAKS
ncbi:MAG: hypothetical protein K9J06_01150 [Flavobacteriales bacterium]|nr:hypothetical protein [Flavobacteriales bacterium]